MSDAVTGTDVAMLDALPKEQQELAVTMILHQAKQWMARALEATTPAREVAEFKAFVATVAEAAKQKKLSEAIRLEAVEMERRSERALGVAIRKGQDAGEINTRATGPAVRDLLPDAKKISPDDFLPHGQERFQVYTMTDGVTDEQFEAVLTEAKAERNLSRANVVRKVTDLGSFREQQDAKWDRVADLADRGYTSSQIARELGMSEKGLRDGAKRYNITFPADAIVGRTKRIDPADVIERIVASLEADQSVLGLVRYEDITPEQADEWLARLTNPLRAINQMKKRLKEVSGV